MRRKIETLLVAMATAGMLLAGPVLAWDRDAHNRAGWRFGEEWHEHHPFAGHRYGTYQVYRHRGGNFGPAWRRPEWRHRDFDRDWLRRADRDDWRGHRGWDRD